MIKNNEHRDIALDIVRGILIIGVVIGHTGGKGNALHDIVFLFHMPLFFGLSGYLYKEIKFDCQYLKKLASRYLIPYMAYIITILLFLDRDFSISHLARLAYGGKAIYGTYWYITCLVFALLIFTFMKNHFKDKTIKCLILAGGGIAVIESHLIEHIGFLNNPGIPWNLDVSLMALVYIAMSYYNKDRIRKLLHSEDRQLDLTAALITALLIVFCFFNYRSGKALYYFDMKPVYYKEFFSAIVIPCLFGVVLCRIVYWIGQIGILGNGLAVLGRMTIPIMFLHVPLNQWEEVFGYGRITYVVIGLGIPVVFTVVFCRFKVMRKLFGLPELFEKSSKKG